MDFLQQLEEIQQERKIYSDQDKNESNIKEFKEYLVKSEAFLAITKFLVCLRNSKERPDDPMKALQEYFGSQKSSNDDLQQIIDECNQLKQEKSSKLQQIEKTKTQIEEIKHQIHQKEKEKKEQEEIEANKNQKKGKK